MSKSKQNLIVWVEVAVIAALGFVLSLIPLQGPNAAFDVSLGVIPLVLFSFRRGAIPAMFSGMIWGLISILVGKAYIVTVPQVLFEYPFAFAFAGLGGLFSTRLKQALQTQKTTKALMISISAAFVSIFSRWFWHFWAGVFIWGVYAPKGQSPYLYSFLLNGASFLANFILMSMILVFFIKFGGNRLNRLLFPAK